MSVDFLDGAVVDERSMGSKRGLLSEKSAGNDVAYIPSSRPFPTLNVATLAARRDANSAYMADWTNILFAQTHV